MFWKRRKDNPTPYAEHKLANAEITFRGEPNGDGAEYLKSELTRILDAEGNTDRAHLLGVQYQAEEKIRLALVVEGTEAPEKMAASIAAACRDLVAIDIFFIQSLSEDLRSAVWSVKPFYSRGDT